MQLSEAATALGSPLSSILSAACGSLFPGRGSKWGPHHGSGVLPPLAVFAGTVLTH